MKYLKSFIAKSILKSVVSAALVLGLVSTAKTESIQLTVASFTNGSHLYYHELLIEALKAEGHQLQLIVKEDMPQKRVVQSLDRDLISLHWLVQSAERDAKYVPVKVGLTNSLIGHRILLIPKGQQSVYDNVQSVEDFRALGKVGAFGLNWFDVRVWKHNDLAYLEQDGDWRVIYKMLTKKRGVDYFSRGFIEIRAEAQQYDFLDVEQRLMLIYDRDFHFYLSKSGAPHAAALENALTQAKTSGLMDKLIRKHWAKDFEMLNFDQRLKLSLKIPKT